MPWREKCFLIIEGEIMNQKQKELQKKLEKIKKNQTQFSVKQQNANGALKATRQNTHAASSQAHRRSGI